MKPNVYCVLPAYNEEKGLPLVIKDLHEKCAELDREAHFVVVNDGSKDRTQEVAEEAAKTYSVEIIRHETNKNVGAVFRNGLTRAAERAKPTDYIWTLESDNTSTPDLYTRMIQRLDEGHDIVTGSRYQKGGSITGFPFTRRVYSWGINTMLRFLYPIPGVTDYSIFARGYQADVVQRSLAFYGDDWIESVGFVANAEILIKARKLKIKGSSVSMHYRYEQAGGSGLNVKKTITEYFQFFSRLRACAKKYKDKPVPPPASASEPDA